MLLRYFSNSIILVLLFILILSNNTANADGASWQRVESTCHDVEEVVLDCLINNNCETYKEEYLINPNQLKGLLNAFFTIENRCIVKTEIKKKVPFLNLLLRQHEFFITNNFGFVPVSSELCGGVLNPSYTRIETYPEEIDMEIGDVDVIHADVIHRYYSGDENTMCGCEEDSFPCEEEKLKVNIDWFSANEDIVKIIEVDASNNDITIEALGEGQTYIYARVPEAEDFGEALGESVSILVGSKVDILFVFDTNALPYGWGACSFPGGSFCSGESTISDYAADYYSTIKSNYPAFKAGLFSYSNHQNMCLYNDPYTWCGEPLSACYSFRTHSNSMNSQIEFINSFNSLSPVCNATPRMAGPPNAGPYYDGASLYTGIIQAIDTFYWRGDAKKFLILVGWTPAGLYQWPFNCTDVEPISNISRNQVIQKATAKEVKIIAINSRGWIDCHPNLIGGQSDNACVRADFNAFALGTAGKYYDSSLNIYDCYPPAYEVILNAIEDIKNITD